MLKSIPLSRVFLYFLCLGLLPLFFMGFLFVSKSSEVDDFENSLEEMRDQIFIKEKKQALNLAVRQHFHDADHFYIDKHLETLVFLEPEIETLQRMSLDKNFADDERIKKRLEFLTGDGNTLNFSEGVVHSFPLFQETLETLTHPVEIDEKDLKTILARIEGIPMGDQTIGLNRPQLIITEFKMDKKKITDKNEVFLLNMKLIKREFL